VIMTTNNHDTKQYVEHESVIMGPVYKFYNCISIESKLYYYIDKGYIIFILVTYTM